MATGTRAASRREHGPIASGARTVSTQGRCAAGGVAGELVALLLGVLLPRLRHGLGDGVVLDGLGHGLAAPLGVEAFEHRLPARLGRSEEHTSELQSRENLVCR